jgi:glycosyltransferase involved in cell wall biosynthesis
MLSICLPTHNYNATEFVKELHKQCLKCNIQFEIIIIDDGSEKHLLENKALENLENIKYIHQKENKGRSYTRNKLADLSSFDYILFVDCDSLPLTNTYISNYLKQLPKDIICGGTAYLKSQKKENHELRYKYGIKREAVKAAERSINPNDSFTTNNFIIKREIIKKIRFRESIKNYGHEDTLLGIDLNNSGFRIKHIDNPVIHLGIEDNSSFVKKTETSILNLIDIEKNNIISKENLCRIKLYKTFSKLNKYKLSFIIKLISILAKNKIKHHLITSTNPTILFLDIYKLIYLFDNYRL